MTDLHFKSHAAPSFGALSAKAKRELPTCAILIPTYGRVDRLHAVVANARDATPQARVYLLMEPGEACQIVGAVTLTRQEGFGNYATAINYGLANTDEPLVFAGADDLNFRPGWLEACQPALDDGNQVVGTNDLGNPEVLAGEHATHYLVVRDYLEHVGGVFDEPPGVFLPDCYEHDYTDREFVEIAKRRGVWTPCLDAIVEHNHPAWGKAEIDATYQKGAYSGSTPRDHELYGQRLAEYEAMQ